MTTNVPPLPEARVREYAFSIRFTRITTVFIVVAFVLLATNCVLTLIGHFLWELFAPGWAFMIYGLARIWYIRRWNRSHNIMNPRLWPWPWS